MKPIKTILSASLLFANILLLSACSNSVAEKKTTNADNAAVVQKNEVPIPTDIKPTANLQADLDKAKNAGKPLFIVVTDKATTEAPKAIAIANEAIAICKDASIIMMNRDDAPNAKWVADWRLSGAPLPLILVISPKGFPVGGYILSQASAQNVAQLVPSPKMDEIYESLNNEKPVFIVVYKKSFTDKSEIIDNCKAAASQLQNNATVIEVDFDDPKEAAFINKLNIPNSPNASSVIVLNSSGQTTGTFQANAQTAQLVSAANKIIRSSCCPGGSCN